jgi:hypothetical protein
MCHDLYLSFSDFFVTLLSSNMTGLLSVLQHLDLEKSHCVTHGMLFTLSVVNKELHQLIITKLPKALLVERIENSQPVRQVYRKLKNEIRNILSYPAPQYYDDRVAVACVVKIHLFAVYGESRTPIQNEIDNTPEIVEPVNALLTRFRDYPEVVVCCLNFLSYIMTVDVNPYSSSNRFGRTFHEMIELYIDKRDSLCSIMCVLNPACNRIGRGYGSRLLIHDEFNAEFSLLILRVLRRNVSALKMCVPTMSVLQRLCSSPVLDKILVESGLVESITETVQTHVNNEDIAETFCRILYSICQGVNRNVGVRKIEELDSLRVVREILQRFEGNVDVVSAAEMARDYCVRS